jgi:GT2 family glycosyltransferase
MKITVGIPTLNRTTYLRATVLNLLKINDNIIYDIIIVDQTADDLTIEENRNFFQKLDFKIDYIFLNTPSVCVARNIIISKSNSDIIFFIDDDVILPNNYFNEHLHMYKNYNVVSTIGKIYNRNLDASIESLDLNFPNINTNENFSYCNNIDIDFKGPGISCNQSFKRITLLEVFGFDENFHGGYFEDADLVNRIRNKGYKIGFNPEAFLIHLKAPMGGLRFDTIQPISFEIKFYSYLFFYIRYFKFNLFYLLDFYKVLRAGPLLKQNVLTINNGILLWLKTPFLLIKCVINKNNIKSILK